MIIRTMTRWHQLMIAMFSVVMFLSGGIGASHADPITEAENWFNQITTMKARFIQVSDDGTYAEGDFLLRRPFRSRFDYDEPIKTVLITTKIWLHVDDPERQTVTSYPISETPFKILFDEKIRLSYDGIITTAASQDGIVVVRMEKRTGSDAGILELEFTEKPFVLRRWTITDSSGITTKVTFQNIEMGVTLPANLFVPSNYQN